MPTGLPPAPGLTALSARYGLALIGLGWDRVGLATSAGFDSWPWLGAGDAVVVVELGVELYEAESEARAAF